MNKIQWVAKMFWTKSCGGSSMGGGEGQTIVEFEAANASDAFQEAHLNAQRGGGTQLLYLARKEEIRRIFFSELLEMFRKHIVFIKLNHKEDIIYDEIEKVWSAMCAWSKLPNAETFNIVRQRILTLKDKLRDLRALKKEISLVISITLTIVYIASFATQKTVRDFIEQVSHEFNFRKEWPPVDKKDSKFTEFWRKLDRISFQRKSPDAQIGEWESTAFLFDEEYDELLAEARALLPID